MTYRIEIEDTTYFIAHGPDALHFGCAERGQVLNSGQPNLETFADETAWASRVRELGGQPYDPININEADTATLQALSGVGPVRADQIIGLRASLPGGRFDTVEQLTQVSGIGDDDVARWQDDPGLEV